MRMPDGNSHALFLCIPKSQLKLFANGGNFGDIVEEGDVPKTGADTHALGGVEGYGGCSGTAVHVEQVPLQKHRHQLFH